MTTQAEQAYEDGRAGLLAGDRKRAMAGFLMAVAIAPDDRRYQSAALDILTTATGYASLPTAVLEALVRCTSNPDLDLQALAMVVRNLLAHNPHRTLWLELTNGSGSHALEQSLASGGFDGLITDPLLRAVLDHATNISLDLEDILTGLRRHAAMMTAQEQNTCLLSTYVRSLT